MPEYLRVLVYGTVSLGGGGCFVLFFGGSPILYKEYFTHIH